MNNERSVVLIADDHPASREILTEWLIFEGYQVLTAEDGEEALEAILTQEVDLVLLDVMMPKRSGFAVCKAIKSNQATRLIPVVMVTGLSNFDDRILGIEAGADDFLTKPVNHAELRARVRSLLKLKYFTDEMEHAERVLEALARSIEAKDAYTEGHCDRLSKYGVVLAQHLGLAPEECAALRRAGVVHDIGKVAVPEAILSKPGSLTEAERGVMKLHPVTGEQICAPLKSFRRVTPIIRHHHERMDGSGYPDGLKGDSIPLTARILSVVDVFDALTTNRPYHAAIPAKQALRLMREEADQGWWDMPLVEEFSKMVRGNGYSLQHAWVA